MADKLMEYVVHRAGSCSRSTTDYRAFLSAIAGARADGAIVPQAEVNSVITNTPIATIAFSRFIFLLLGSDEKLSLVIG